MNWWVEKVYTSLNYIEIFLILASAITGFNAILLQLIYFNSYISFYIFQYITPWLGIPIGITSSAIGSKTFAITVAIKKYKLMIKKKKKEA